ncbi:endolytic transglycosylase MltG [Alteromonas gilva]|uniref:Endolytic murein transglycosylase n=1 Tax=Alteromonas gilva TaxID=2987522 RepID=A0ABT5L2K2_9ALTE|nr:endolytic transglycosylase MltG [Alteromonas gilva]MDC8831265.1 endolytic transglycosylase MltG [Alteromonas gilva]
MLRKLLIVTVIVVAMAIALLSWVQQQLNQPLNIQQRQLFTQEAGKGAIATLYQFEQNGWLPMPVKLARLWLKIGYSGQPVKAGTYYLAPPLTLADAFNTLSTGAEAQFDISLIEGQTLRQWQAVLAEHPYVKNDLDTHYGPVMDELLRQWQVYSNEQLNSAEGLLLADTYHFTAHTAATDILRRASAAMQDFLLAGWQSRPPGLPYDNPVEVLTMASIIEKETALAEERQRIAGVFVNRLEQNMRLQTDPTVIYGIGEAFDGNLTRAHLREATPYNTYVHHGLPPGPIAMVGRAAINAALAPAVTDELYFVSRGDGSHQFSVTLEEHNKAVRKYQLNQ